MRFWEERAWLFIYLCHYVIVEDSYMEEESSTKEMSPTRVKAVEGHSNKVPRFHYAFLIDLFMSLESCL